MIYILTSLSLLFYFILFQQMVIRRKRKMTRKERRYDNAVCISTQYYLSTTFTYRLSIYEELWRLRRVLPAEAVVLAPQITPSAISIILHMI